jgi:hypothetical protein
VGQKVISGSGPASAPTVFGAADGRGGKELQLGDAMLHQCDRLGCGRRTRQDRVVQVGNLPGKAVPASLGDLVTREITCIGSYRLVDEISDAVAVMENGLDVTPLITLRYPINEATQAIAVVADRNSGSGKILLQLGGG